MRAKLPENLRGVVTFAYLTGWRINSEVLPLQWLQVDRREKVVRLEPGATKNRKGRTFPYGALPELAAVIESQWAEHKRLAAEGKLCPHVFHRDGRRIKNLRGAWLAACDRAGVPGKLVHDFRRTAVRNLTRAGAPDTVAMKLTGHKTRTVFDRYNLTSEAELREAVARLAAAGAARAASGGRVRRYSKALRSR